MQASTLYGVTWSQWVHWLHLMCVMWCTVKLIPVEKKHIEKYNHHSVSIVCPAVCSGARQRKHQSSLGIVRGIYRRAVDSPHKGPVTRNMFPFDDVIMITQLSMWTWFEMCWQVSRYLLPATLLVRIQLKSNISLKNVHLEYYIQCPSWNPIIF